MIGKVCFGLFKLVKFVMALVRLRLVRCVVLSGYGRELVLPFPWLRGDRTIETVSVQSLSC